MSNGLLKKKKQIGLLIILLGMLANCVSPPNVPGCRSLTHKQVLIKDKDGLPLLDPRGRMLYDYRPNPVCMKNIKEPTCGRCTWTIDDKVQYVGNNESNYLDGQSWLDIQLTGVIFPAQSVAKVKGYIVNQCKKTNCNDNISKWRVKINSF